MEVKLTTSKCDTYLNVGNVFVGLVSNEVLQQGYSDKARSIVCFDRSGSILWMKRSLEECEYWQSNDSFVNVVESFYFRPSDSGYLSESQDLYKKPGKVRVITFQGFSYEIDVNTGKAIYFDFHK